MSDEYEVRPIGVVEKVNEISEIQIYPEYHQALTAIDDYKKLMILLWMHPRDNEKDRAKLMSSRPRHGKEGFRGVFASHSPHRPNSIGVTYIE